MKSILILSLIVASAFTLRVDLKRENIGPDYKSQAIKDISNGNIRLVSSEEIEMAIKGVSSPLVDQFSANAGQNSVIDLDNFKDLQYYGPVEVGSEREEFKTVWDTGSGWIWVPGKGCGHGCSANIHEFDPRTSSTYEGTGVSKTLSYGKGQVRGEISYDQFSIGGLDQVRAKFIPATSGKDNDHAQATGIVGLTPVATGGEDLLVDRLFEEGIFDAREFTAYIGHENEQSYIDLGTNHDVSPDEIAWTDLQNLPGDRGLVYWSTNFESFAIGNRETELAYTSTIWDTGTSVIGFSSKDLASVIKTLAGDRQIFSVGQGFYGVECDHPSEIEDLQFTFGGRTINVPSSEFILQEQGVCIFFLLQVPMKAALLGDQFLRGLRIIHDVEGLRLGVLPDGNNRVDQLIK